MKTNEHGIVTSYSIELDPLEAGIFLGYTSRALEEEENLTVREVLQRMQAQLLRQYGSSKKAEHDLLLQERHSDE